MIIDLPQVGGFFTPAFLRNVVGNRVDMDGHCDAGLELLVASGLIPWVASILQYFPADSVSDVLFPYSTTGLAGGFLVLREKDIKVPLLDVVTFVLLLADFLLDIDVVLTKIQEIPNTYIGFLSALFGFL